MKLRELFTPDVVNLRLTSKSKAETLEQLVSLLQLDEKSEGILFKTLKRRENLGSTGIRKSVCRLDAHLRRSGDDLASACFPA